MLTGRPHSATATPFDAATWWAVALLALLAVTASLQAADTGQETPLETHQGYTGAWLRSDTAEVFVAVEPAFRLLDLRRIGRPGLLAGPETAEWGVRLAKMEPQGGDDSFGVGAQAGQLQQMDEASASVRLEPDGGLRYEIEVALAADAPRLDATYRLFNDSAEPRTYACWSVLAFARDGRIVMPFGRAPRSRRRLVIPVWATWPQPGVAFGRRALVADAGAPLNGHTYKIGVITDDGWIAFLRGGEALVTWSAFDAAATYPEDGANITCFAFQGKDGVKAWAETERVSPLQRVTPGGFAELRETFLLLEVPAPAAEPDKLREQIEAAMPPLAGG